MAHLPIHPGMAPGGRHDAWRGPTRRRYEFVVADVDGTLHGEGAAVDARTVEVLRACVDNGLAVGYATGRMHTALASVDAQLQLPGPHVVHNGAMIRHNGATARMWPLEDGEVAAVLAIAARFDLYVELYLEEGYLVTRDDADARRHWLLLGDEPEQVAPPGMLQAVDGRPITKATFITRDRRTVGQLVAALEEAGLAAGPAGSPHTPELTYVNATRRGVDKGHALAVAAELAGTDLEHTVAVGDGGNDIEMLRAAGLSVAMGQASDAVKAVAHVVAPHVDDGGFARGLLPYVKESWRTNDGGADGQSAST